jgi:hypothetical protein
MKYFAGGEADGEWKNDLLNGKAKMIYANGDTYDGYWKDGKRDGLGVLQLNYDGGR